MADHFLGRLNDGWALLADQHQWIVARRRNKRDTDAWKPVAYIATGKPILLRVLREMDVVPDAVGEALLAQLPTCFGAKARDRGRREG